MRPGIDTPLPCRGIRVDRDDAGASGQGQTHSLHAEATGSDHHNRVACRDAERADGMIGRSGLFDERDLGKADRIGHDREIRRRNDDVISQRPFPLDSNDLAAGAEVDFTVEAGVWPVMERWLALRVEVAVDRRS